MALNNVDFLNLPNQPFKVPATKEIISSIFQMYHFNDIDVNDLFEMIRQYKNIKRYVRFNNPYGDLYFFNDASINSPIARILSYFFIKTIVTRGWKDVIDYVRTRDNAFIAFD